MLVELTPAAYLALCGLVRDALEMETDASPLLTRVEAELMGATTSDLNTAELVENPAQAEALRRGGFMVG